MRQLGLFDTAEPAPAPLAHGTSSTVDLPLAGCASEPLLAYLKALGVFRLVAEQADPAARAYWEDDVLHLVSRLGRDALTRFFLDVYAPTPVVAPWNGGSGFYSKDNREAISAIEDSSTLRLHAYRATISTAREVLGPAARAKPTDPEIKRRLLRQLRARLPDAALAWLDVVAADTDERLVFAPLLGTGGNDGRLDFSQTFMQRVVDVVLALDPDLASRRLRHALFEDPSPPLVEASVGQFDPGGVGGPNARPGFEASSLVNPWDFVLMIEGALLFAGAVARRLGAASGPRGAFPFTVAASAAGWGTLATDEARSARAEVWLPLWPRPTGLGEARHLFGEGRAQVGRRAARNGVDFARAVASLGVDRGIDAFRRYGFLQRSGKSYLAAPLGKLPVRAAGDVRLLDELDGWLGSLRSASEKKGVPPRYAQAARRIDEAIFAYCQSGTPGRMGDVLAALGAAERELAVGALKKSVRPLARLSPAWTRAANDGSVEFRLALALASIGNGATSIRCQLEAVSGERNRWAWAPSSLGVAWGGDNLPRNLALILARRQIEAESDGWEGDRDNPNPALGARCAASLPDVAAFLRGEVDDARIADLLWALTALRWHQVRREDLPPRPRGVPDDLPRAFALLKLLHLDRPVDRAATEPLAIPSDPAILPRLGAGDLSGAVRIAYRRLRGRGAIPLGGIGPEGREPPDLVFPRHLVPRLAASLLIPIDQTRLLAGLVLRPSRESDVPA